MDRFAENRNGKIFAEDERILLRSLAEGDRETYLGLSGKEAFLRNYYLDEAFTSELWEEYASKKHFHCSIFKKCKEGPEEIYIGQCGVLNVDTDEWELEIEIREEERGKGYGKEAFGLFIQMLRNYLDGQQLVAIVRADNLCSQKMCEALGGVVAGLVKICGYSQEEMERYEQRYHYQVTEAMQRVAWKMHVAPEKFLTHALWYRFD